MSKEAHEECGKNMASTEEKIEAHEESGKNMASTEEKIEAYEDSGKNMASTEEKIEAHEECGKNMASTEEKTEAHEECGKNTDNVLVVSTDNVLVLSKDSDEEYGKNIASNEEELDCTENAQMDRGKNIAFPEDKPDCTESHEEPDCTDKPDCTRSLKNELTATVQEELTMTTAIVHIQESNKNECTGIIDDDRGIKMSDNLTIDSTFVDLCTSIAVAENTVALSSLPPVQGARASTPISDASDDEVPLSQLIPKGFKIKKNVKSGTNNKRITRSAKLPSSA